jgi:hypothetical protein
MARFVPRRSVRYLAMASTEGFHQLAEQRAKQKNWKELPDETGRVARERLGPVCQQRLACQQRSNQGTQQNTPAPISESDQKNQSDQDSDDTHRASSSLQARFTKRRLPSALRHQRIEIGARLAAEIRAVPCQKIHSALSALYLEHLEEFPFSVEL